MKEVLETANHLHEYDDMVEQSDLNLSYPSTSVQVLLGQLETPKVFVLTQVSEKDGISQIGSVTPCATFEIAKRVMNEKVNEVLTTNEHFTKLEADEFTKEETKTGCLIFNHNDPYSESFEITEVEILTK